MALMSDTVVNPAVKYNKSVNRLIDVGHGGDIRYGTYV